MVKTAPDIKPVTTPLRLVRIHFIRFAHLRRKLSLRETEEQAALCRHLERAKPSER